MEWYIVAITLLIVSVTVADDSQELRLAEPCKEDLCQLPNCRCSSTQVPGGFEAQDVPQFVLLTFDDAVNIRNIETYRRLFGRTNSNGCPIGATFYINHEYTDYTIVNELYNRRFEIALHSISHQIPQTYWQNANYEDIKKEFGDQKEQMAHFANIPIDAINGLRAPFLQMTGNASFEVMAEYGLQYDCTWPTITHHDPGLWPYTLDYASSQDCAIPPCPTASIPGVWVIPMVTWRDLKDSPCAMVDSCFHVPPIHGAHATQEWFDFIMTNFKRHYEGNRSPFGFYVHEWYLSIYPPVREALLQFVEHIGTLNDAFLVNSIDVIDWMRNPISANDYRNQPCKPFTPSPCRRTSCGPLYGEHNHLNYWMQICTTCPRTYPWLDNPLGK